MRFILFYLYVQNKSLLLVVVAAASGGAARRAQRRALHANRIGGGAHMLRAIKEEREQMTGREGEVGNQRSSSSKRVQGNVVVFFDRLVLSVAEVVLARRDQDTA